MNNAAVFLDRDGTIIEDRHHLGDPDEVRLLPDAARAIRMLSDEGFLVIIASNQSGVARGLFDEETLAAVHARLEELLAAENTGLDGAYYCPYLDGPEATVSVYRRDSELRKPKPGMLRQAARELDIDLNRSWMIGDSASDVEAGSRAGCRTILLNGGEGTDPSEAAQADDVVPGLIDAANIIVRSMKRGHAAGPGTPRPPDNDQVLVMLGKIHDQLDRARRPRRQADFSLLRFFGALLQMFAVVAALWGVMALLDDDSGPAAARLMLACFLQLASITAFAIDRFR
jgi:D-glycero-D-manno-heptose 1,7-bisphosphate phosphatase